MFPLLLFFLLISLTSANMSDIEVSLEYLKSLEDNKNVLIIDVREPKELEETGVIPGSINIPLATLEKTLTDSTPEEFKQTYNREKPQLETPLVFSCRSGRRSLAALNIATKLGYLKVKHFPGGWSGYEKGLKDEI